MPVYNDDPDIGLGIAAHFYNTNMRLHNGQLEAVNAAKKMTMERRKAVTFDIERGGADAILPQPLETDTCIGQWHYSKSLAEHHGYKKSPEVIRMQADIVSKNGNLMLSIPVRSDGTIDDDEQQLLKEMGEWLDVNGEGIYATRPWVKYGEGPAADAAAAGAGPMGVLLPAAAAKMPALSVKDIRFTTSKDGKALFAIVLGWPADGQVSIKSLADGSAEYPQ